MRRAFKTGSTRYKEPKRWFPRAGRCWCSRFAKPVQHSGATHEERLGKRNWSTGAPRLTPYVHACGGGNRWCRNSVIVGGPGADGCPAECQQDRPQEEPDGEPDRGSAQVLRGVVRRCRGRRAGRIFHRRRRLPQYPLAPVTGREAIANTIASFIRPGAPGIEGIEFHVINI